MSSIVGFRHVGLSVTDLEVSTRWYSDVLGFVEMFRECGPQRSAVILCQLASGVMVGLVQVRGRAGGGFDPARSGLDHLCFLVEDREVLAGWARRLTEAGVEHSGIREMSTGPIVNFKDPDGIALALATPPAT